LSSRATWLALRRQRCRHANQNDVSAAKFLEVSSGKKTSRGSRCGHLFGRDVRQIRVDRVELTDIGVVEIKTHHGETRLGSRQGQRQPDVTHADDSNNGLPGPNLVEFG
jgi:hypothetical protein